MYDLTVIIPTLNEGENIRDIIQEVDAVCRIHFLNGQILVVDDQSTDTTIDIVQDMVKSMGNVDLLVRTEDHGLSQSVAEGFAHADTNIIVVIDADFSHPPALIPVMYREIKNGADIVIGSRYMAGGGIRKWPLKRRAISIGATFLGRLLFPDITDPVSGFFAVRKAVIEKAALKPRGYKILLEVLGKGRWDRVKEIPFEFVDREAGSSKLRVKTIVDYARQVADISLHSFTHHESGAWREWTRVFRFGAVGITGIAVNLGALLVCVELLAMNKEMASPVAIEISIISNFLLNDVWTFGAAKGSSLTCTVKRLLAFNVVSLGGAGINYAIFLALTSQAAVYYPAAQFAGVLTAFGWNFIVNRRITWKANGAEES